MGMRLGLALVALAFAGCGGGEDGEDDERPTPEGPSLELVIAAVEADRAFEPCGPIESNEVEPVVERPTTPELGTAILCDGLIAFFHERFADERARAEADVGLRGDVYLVNGPIRVRGFNLPPAGPAPTVRTDGPKGQRRVLALLEAVRRECGCGEIGRP